MMCTVNVRTDKHVRRFFLKYSLRDYLLYMFYIVFLSCLMLLFVSCYLFSIVFVGGGLGLFWCSLLVLIHYNMINAICISKVFSHSFHK